MIISVVQLATNAYNGSIGGACFFTPHDPPHCIGYKAGDIPEGYSIPCGRGGPYDGLAELRAAITLYGLFVWTLIIAPVIILVTMARMFRSVTNIEKQMQKYGVSALRFRTSLAVPTANTNSADQEREAISFAGKMEKLGQCLCLKGLAACCFQRPRLPSRMATKSNKMTSQKRAVLHMAFGYTGAWLMVYTPYYVNVAFLLVTKSYQDNLVHLVASTIPLQGFFNFLVFMAPKVRNARKMTMRRGRISDNDNNRNQQHLPWCQAFYKAYMSIGRLEDRNMRNNNRSRRGAVRNFLEW